MIAQNWPMWARVFASRYPVRYNFDPPSWQIEIEATLGAAWDEEQLISALRWSQTQEAGTWELRTAADLVRLLRAFWKASRTNAEPPQIPCGLCWNSGWILYRYHVTPQSPLADYLGRTGMSVPCLCGHGQRVLEKVKDYRDLSAAQKAGLRKLAEAAREQLRREYELVEADVRAHSGAAAETENYENLPF